MLEVHPPHEAAHSWRDFFIHIGTICIGLLIAVGIEQTVEAVRFHREVREAREALRGELQDNVTRFSLETRNVEYAVPALRGDLATFVYLRGHPGAAAASWPSPIRGQVMPVLYAEGAWRAIQQSGVIEHLSPAEISHFDRMYTRLTAMNEVEVRKRNAVFEAHMTFAAQPDAASMTPAEIEQEIHAIEALLAICAESALLQRNLSIYVPAFDRPPGKDIAGQGKLLQWPGSLQPDTEWQATIDAYTEIEQRREDEFLQSAKNKR